MPQVLEYTIGEIALGAEVWEVVELDNDQTILEGAVILVDASGDDRITTLPLAGNTPGRVLVVKKVDNSANTVTVEGNGSETVDGDPNVVLTTQYDAVTVVSDGDNWHIIALLT